MFFFLLLSSHGQSVEEISLSIGDKVDAEQRSRKNNGNVHDSIERFGRGREAR